MSGAADGAEPAQKPEGAGALERAHAKVNLGLSVLARRGDGFHEIETVMVRLTLHDDVRVSRAEAGVQLEVEGATLPLGEDNLAVQAARAYLDAAGSGPGVAGLAIHLTKRIPVAAGLGGGSSDAAAVLRALARLAPAGVDLQAVAAGLGSDVPFFVRDLGAALARGRGERLEPVSLPPLTLVLAFPGVAVRAADAYALVQSFTPRLKVDVLVERLAAGGDPGLVNGLQPGVVRRHKVIREVLGALRAEGLRGASMTGSGSCCFALAQGPTAAEDAVRRLQAAHPDWTVLASRTA